MREIRMLRAMWRGLETEPRTSLHGHEGGNPGHSQGMPYGPPRQSSTLPRSGLRRLRRANGTNAPDQRRQSHLAARLVLAGRRFEVRWGAHQAGLKRGHRIALPTGGSHYPMSIRARRSGDRIRLPGGTRSLKRLFSDRQIPLSDRPAVPVLVDASGDVLWVAGVANDTRLGDVRETGGHMVVEIDEVLS